MEYCVPQRTDIRIHTRYVQYFLYEYECCHKPYKHVVHGTILAPTHKYPFSTRYWHYWGQSPSGGMLRCNNILCLTPISTIKNALMRESVLNYASAIYVNTRSLVIVRLNCSWVIVKYPTAILTQGWYASNPFSTAL
jgi:hypothetical protein